MNRNSSNSREESPNLPANKKANKAKGKEKFPRLVGEEKLEFQRWNKIRRKELESYLDDVTVEHERSKGKKAPARGDESSSEAEVCSILSSLLERERENPLNQHHRSLNRKMNEVAIKASLLKE